MPAKNFKAGFKANSLNGRRVTQEDAIAPFGFRDELELRAENLPVLELPIVQLNDNPYQHLARPQLHEEALEELVSSIRQNGFYGALLARRRNNTYELAYGHRRKEAARRAGLVTLPVKVIELTDDKMVRIMASENFSRQDLDPIGEANVVGLMESTQNLSARQIAEIIGKSRNWVERRISLYQASQDIKTMVAQKPDTFSLTDLLATIEDTNLRQEIIAEILSKGLTRREVQERLERIPKSEADIVELVTISSQRGNSEINNNSLDVETEDEPLNPKEVVKPVTISPQRGNSEISNNVGDNLQQEWHKALELIDKGISKLSNLMQQGELPDITRNQALTLSKQLTELLKER